MTPDFDSEVWPALDGDRHASLKLWEQVAAGNLDSDVVYWLQQLANAVVDAESKDVGRLRDSAIIRAVGLAGKKDPHRELRRLVQTVEGFDPKDGPVFVPTQNGLQRVSGFDTGHMSKRRSLINLARHNHGWAEYDPTRYDEKTDDELGKTIDLELKKSKLY